MSSIVEESVVHDAVGVVGTYFVSTTEGGVVFMSGVSEEVFLWRALTRLALPDSRRDRAASSPADKT